MPAALTVSRQLAFSKGGTRADKSGELDSKCRRPLGLHPGSFFEGCKESRLGQPSASTVPTRWAWTLGSRDLRQFSPSRIGSEPRTTSSRNPSDREPIHLRPFILHGVPAHGSGRPDDARPDRRSILVGLAAPAATRQLLGPLGLFPACRNRAPVQPPTVGGPQRPCRRVLSPL